MGYYKIEPEAPVVTFGREIYHSALGDRRGFRPDQIGIPEEDDVWIEIFSALALAALEAGMRMQGEKK